MIKAIVTGGAGFIGSNLVAELLKRGVFVKVIDDLSVGKISNLPKDKNLEMVRASILDKELMVEEFKGFDVVFHLAVQCVRESINNPFLVDEVNTTGTLNVLEAARVNGIGRFLYVSSSEIYGTAESVPMPETHPLNPTTIYGASKLAGEYYTLAYFRTFNMPVKIVRPFNSYGVNAHFEGPYGEVIPRFLVRALNNLPLEIFGDGRQTRDFTFVSDTVRGILEVEEKGEIGEIYNVARGVEVSINDLAKIILKTLGVKVEIKYLDDRPGDILRLYADVSKIRGDLNFEANVDIIDGVKEYVSWFKRNFSPKDALKYYKTQNWI